MTRNTICREIKIIFEADVGEKYSQYSYFNSMILSGKHKVVQ